MYIVLHIATLKYRINKEEYESVPQGKENSTYQNLATVALLVHFPRLSYQCGYRINTESAKVEVFVTVLSGV